FMNAVLTVMSVDATYASFFPLAGQEGTLKKFLAETALDSYIAMKTGSMKGIQCYAGYKLDDNYMPTHTVVIIMNDIVGKRDKAKKAAEKMLLEIFNNNSELSGGQPAQNPDKNE
ncbi:MAG: D-alanyl-D-alanine carboxypeptidase, partial [Muribaculaceae bacterium]|nr:D-alanyl-D-alanine carboxypeptidase [Muribaculaceae bacterium]